MNLQLWTILLAIILFVIGLKIAKKILWGLAIVAVLVAVLQYLF